MRVALRQTGDIGLRAGRILLGEASLARLGLIDSRLGTGVDRRVRHIDDIDGFDVFASDAVDDIEDDIELAAAAGIPCVTWTELGTSLFDDGALDVIHGANMATGLAPALAEHEVRRTGTPLQITVASTVTGQPLRRGEAVPFPDPVGPLWAKQASSERHRRLVAPTMSEWGGIVVDVTTGSFDGVGTRLVGVADLAAHLEAIALAAAAFTAADPGYPADVHDPWWSEAYLAKAFEMGLAVATHTPDS